MSQMECARIARIRAISLVTVHRSPGDIYVYCRDFRNLPRFMRLVHSVRVVDSCRSRWQASPAPTLHAEWDTEIVYDRPHERIAWRSVSTSGLDGSGAFSFRAAPYGLGTDVLLEIGYSSTGKLSTPLTSRLQRCACRQVGEDLRLLKCILEKEVAMPERDNHSLPLIGATA